MEVLFWLLVGFSLFIVLGHLGWVIIARILGYRVKTVSRRDVDPQLCKQCGKLPVFAYGLCRECVGLSKETTPATQSTHDLVHLAQVTTRFYRDGLIDQATQRAMLHAITGERSRVENGSAPRAISAPPIETSENAIGIDFAPIGHNAEPPGAIPFAARLAPGADTESWPESFPWAAPPIAPSPGQFQPTSDPSAPHPAAMSVAPHAGDAAAIISRRPPPPVAPPLVAPRLQAPRRSFGEMLGSFMEENNIRWGELLGGLLIVGCSVALVVSFWAGISHRPWLQFSVFTAVTAGFFVLGLYTEHRWKLPTTSRGILLIATLLVPLNFLAFASFSAGQWPGPLTATSEAAAFALLAWGIWQGSRVIAPVWPELLTVGTCALSATLLVLGRVNLADVSPAKLACLALIPLGVYGAGSLWMLWRARNWQAIHLHGANAILLLLGVLSFATALALGLLTHRFGDAAVAMHHLAFPLSCSGLPALATGMLLWRRLSGARLAAARVAGTGVGVVGALILLAGIVLAWPSPVSMLPIALCDFAALTAIAILLNIPAVHWLALPCAVVAWVLGFHLFRGHINSSVAPDRMLAVMLSPSTAKALAGFTILLAGVWELLGRLGRSAVARVYGTLGVCIGCSSLILLAPASFGIIANDVGAAWVYFALAALALGLTWRTGKLAWSWTTWLLLAAALCQLCVGRHVLPDPWPAALLATATLATLVELAARWHSSKTLALLSLPAGWVAVAAISLSLIITATGLTYAGAGPATVLNAWAGVLLLLIALKNSSPPLFMVGQCVLAFAGSLAVVQRLAAHPWFVQSQFPLAEPWTLQSVGSALACFALAWKLARIACGKADLAAITATSAADGAPSVGRPSSPTAAPLGIKPMLRAAAPFDIWASGIVLAMLVGMVWWATSPALAAEFSAHRATTVDSARLQTIGASAWLLLALVVCLFALHWRETGATAPLAALLCTVWLICPLIAARAAGENAAASALRWLCAGYLLCGAAPLWLKAKLGAFRRRSVTPRGVISRGLGAASLVRILLLILGACPIFLLTIWPTLVTLGGDSFAGPLASSFFGRIGLSLSYAAPLVAVALALVGDAVAERSPNRAFAAAVVLCFTVSLGYLLSLATARISLGGAEGVHLLQINALTLAGSASLWMGLRQLFPGLQRNPGSLPGAVNQLVRLGLILNAVVIVPATALLSLAPTSASAAASAGGPWGWIALLVAVGAAILSGAIQPDRLKFRTLAVAAMALAAMVGLSTIAAPAVSGWTAFHVLLMADALAAWALLGVGWRLARRPSHFAAASAGAGAGSVPVLGYFQRPGVAAAPAVCFGGQPVKNVCIHWSSLVGFMVLLLAVRALAGDPQAPWWSMGSALCMAFLWITLACWGLRPALLYGAAVLLNLAEAMWRLHRLGIAGLPQMDFLATQTVVAAVPGVAWLVLELKVFRPNSPSVRREFPAVHHAAAIGSCLVAVVIAISVLISRGESIAVAHNPLLEFAAGLAAAGLMVACLCDDKARYAPAGLYALGVGAIAMVLDAAGVGRPWLASTAVASVAAYALLTSFLAARPEPMTQLLKKFGMPEGAPGRTNFLPFANSAIALGTILYAEFAAFNIDSTAVRFMLASAALSQAMSLGLLSARGKFASLQPLALLIVVIGLPLCGWSWLPAGGSHWLERCSIAFISLSACVGAFGVLTPRVLPEGAWRISAREIAWPTVVLAFLALLATLAAEGFQLASQPNQLLHGYAIAVALTILSACAISLHTALRPPETMGFSHHARLGLVYASEFLLAIMFVHLRLTAPQLFLGFFQPYWPLIIMAIAFAGATAAEVFHRRNIRVLSEPLGRTGLFLPLLPVIGIWAAPAPGVNFGELLLVVATFYAILAGVRRSLPLAAAAALAANGALWQALAHSQQFGFLQHPQLWMIPGAASMLVGAQLNRQRLSRDRLSTIRSACLIVIYASSTADVFLNGVGKAPWLPLVLAAFSTAGVLVGVLLRIRAFLILGMSFLLVSVITMIYFASSQYHWTWIWYVAGIFLGSAILTLFALFEKKREQMLSLLEGLKQWE